MSAFTNTRLIQLIFFGNYFYGLCAVALCLESGLQQKLPLNAPEYYALTFCITVLFYTQAYVKTETPSHNDNQRAQWYNSNRGLISFTQTLFATLSLLLSLLLFRRHYNGFTLPNAMEFVLLLSFPVAALLYYFPGRGRFNLRNVGWLKPFIIGFIWTGAVNVYPALFYYLSHGTHSIFSTTVLLLFLKNFMFISILCIMFDIKDYAMDYNHQLKTFVVKAGLRYTIFYIIVPLTLLALAFMISIATIQQFNPWRIILNALPFLGILLVAYSLQKRKSIFYYLIIIDGLMLVKSAAGILAVVYFGN
ncbi:MAG: hypothetical protein IT236_14565 [Bacteroidia bacterium]|nr:hypothetical protein [Bacteroidia bacterium]